VRRAIRAAKLGDSPEEVDQFEGEVQEMTDGDDGCGGGNHL